LCQAASKMHSTWHLWTRTTFNCQIVYSHFGSDFLTMSPSVSVRRSYPDNELNCNLPRTPLFLFPESLLLEPGWTDLEVFIKATMKTSEILRICWISIFGAAFLLYIHDPNPKICVCHPRSLGHLVFFKCILSKTLWRSRELIRHSWNWRNARTPCNPFFFMESLPTKLHIWILEGGPLVGVFVYSLQSAAQKVLGFLFTLFESGLNLKPRAVGGVGG